MKKYLIYLFLSIPSLAYSDQNEVIEMPSFNLETPETYAKSRLDMASEKGFDGYKLTRVETYTQSEAQKLMNNGKINESISKQMALVYTYPLSITGNTILGETYRWLSADPKKSDTEKVTLTELSKKYLARADLLVQSITNGTDCTTKENQCKVININEEYMILRKLGYKPKSKDLLIDIDKKIAFDKFTAVNAKGESKEFYFDIWLITPGNPRGAPFSGISSEEKNRLLSNIGKTEPKSSCSGLACSQPKDE